MAATWLPPLVVGLVAMLLLSGCSTPPPRDLPAILRAVNAGQYQYVDTHVWYHGRWVRVLEPRRDVRVPAVVRGPKA
jgi:hypothetical protein